MKPTFFRLDGRDYAILPRADYDRLRDLAKVGAQPSPAVTGADLANRDREARAREIVRRRTIAGATQRDLAAKAGIRFETLSRIERGHSAPSTTTVARLEVALGELEAAAATSAKRARRKAR